MHEEAVILFQAGSFSLTAYGAMMALAMVLGAALTLWAGQKRQGVSQTLSMCLWTALGAVLGGHLVYCLANIETLLVDYDQGLGLFFLPQAGGYTLFGAVLGGLGALAIYAAAVKKPCAPMVDTLVPGAMIAVCLGRLGEYFTDQGLGSILDDEGPLFFPLGVPVSYAGYDDYVEWHVPVFIYEAAAALVLCLCALWLLKLMKRPGAVTGRILTIFCACQIFLEQLREDDFIRFLFVRFSQICAIVIIGAIFVLRLVRTIRSGGMNWALWRRISLFVFSVVTVIFVEFVLEKPQFTLPLLLSGFFAAFFVSCVRRKWLVGYLLAGAFLVCGGLILADVDFRTGVLMFLMALSLGQICLAVEVGLGEDGRFA